MKREASLALIILLISMFLLFRGPSRVFADEEPVWFGLSGYSTGATGIDGNTTNVMQNHGMNIYRLSFSPVWYNQSRPWSADIVNYTLNHTAYNVVVDGNHLWPGDANSTQDAQAHWDNVTRRIFEVLEAFPNNPRVMVELVNEYDDDYARDFDNKTQDLITSIRAAGYTNAIVADRHRRYHWTLWNDPLNATYQGFHVYMNDGNATLAWAEGQMQQARNVGITKLLNTEVGANSVDSLMNQTTVQALGDFLKWCYESNDPPIMNCVWMWQNARNWRWSIGYEAFGLALPSPFNQPPSNPSINGADTAYIGESYYCNVSSADPEQHTVCYEIDWDDNSNHTITSYYNSTETVCTSHIWNVTGTYYVRVKVKDWHAGQSEWSNRTVMVLIGEGGCPFVYVWNGSQFALDNNILSASELSNGTDVEDYYKLEQTPAPIYTLNGTSFYALKLGEFENEHSYIDKVMLTAVDHDPDVKVTVTAQGEILTYRNPQSPLTCTDNHGYDRLGEIQYEDGNVSDLATFFFGVKNDSLLLNFGEFNGSIANLVLRDDWKCDDACIEVQVPDGASGWQTVAVLHPRDYWGMEAVNMTAFLPAEGDFIVRLLWTAPHRLDYVGLDTTGSENFTATTAQLVYAFHSSEGNVLSELSSSDDSYAELVPGQQILLAFSLPNTEAGKTRTFIFHSEGHYFTIE
jgi:hypothetical protein